jgi:hypothetical protein
MCCSAIAMERSPAKDLSSPISCTEKNLRTKVDTVCVWRTREAKWLHRQNRTLACTRFN